MQFRLSSLKNLVCTNQKVVENYFFMTFLQGAHIVIGILLYPYLIRVLEKDAYGTYVFIYSNIQFFVSFIGFGFGYPALKSIALHQEDVEEKNRTLHAVFTAKVCLFALSSVVLGALLLCVPFMREHALLYITVYAVTLHEVVFPSWYFQGMQRMKFVTYLQLAIRLSTIPLILLFIKSPDDLELYAIIVSVLPLLGTAYTVWYLKRRDGLTYALVPLGRLKTLFRDSLPFFWTSAFGTVKQELVTLIIGSFFRMGDVALYDLANKLITIPRLMINNINAALFPDVVRHAEAGRVKRLIRYETFIGLAVVVVIAALGYWAVLLLGGRDMLGAYPLAVALSVTVYTWLVVGGYINYVFVPQGHYYFVTKNQFVALVTFVVFALAGVFLWHNIFMVVAAYSLSGLVEIVYCKYLIKKNRLYA